MSQVGEAHKMLMRHLDWVAKELETLGLVVFADPDSDAAFTLKTAMLHLENARRLAVDIDSGIVYGN